MHPGWKTSEFWIALITQVLSLLTVLGFVNADGLRTLEDALSKCVAAVFLFVANAYVVVQYIRGRVLLKREGAAGKALVLLLLGGWLLGAAEAQAAAPTWFGRGWRSQVEQRLNEHQRLIAGLLHGQQAPPPQIILLPVPGEPKQQLPLGGEPKQLLPVPGEPRQVLPGPGQPQQTLPLQGLPRWESPQSYTIFALGRPVK